MTVSGLGEAWLADAALLLHAYVHPQDVAGARLSACRAVVSRLLASHAGHFELAFLQGEPAGFMVWTWSVSTSTGHTVLRIEALYTAPRFRGRGVASALLGWAVEVARAGGANRLQLDANARNAPALRLYRRAGFEVFPGKRVLMRFL